MRRQQVSRGYPVFWLWEGCAADLVMQLIFNHLAQNFPETHPQTYMPVHFYFSLMRLASERTAENALLTCLGHLRCPADAIRQSCKTAPMCSSRDDELVMLDQLTIANNAKTNNAI